MYYGELKVADVLELLKGYEDYSVTIFGVEGIRLDITDTYVNAESYCSSYKDFDFETQEALVEYIEWLESMIIYRDLTVKKLLELLQPHKDKDFYICEDVNIVIEQPNCSSISFEYAG